MNIIPLAKIVTYFGIAKYLGWKINGGRLEVRVEGGKRLGVRGER